MTLAVALFAGLVTAEARASLGASLGAFIAAGLTTLRGFRSLGEAARVGVGMALPVAGLSTGFG